METRIWIDVWDDRGRLEVLDAGDVLKTTDPERLIRNLPFARAREAKTTRPYHWSAEKWTYIL